MSRAITLLLMNKVQAHLSYHFHYFSLHFDSFELNSFHKEVIDIFEFLLNEKAFFMPINFSVLIQNLLSI